MQLNNAEIDRQIETAVAKQKQSENEPIAKAVWYDKDKKVIVIRFNNGCQFSCPTYLLQGLEQLPEDEIAKVKLTPAGWGLTWENADIDLGVKELIGGIFGTRAWMKEIGSKIERYKLSKKQAAFKTNEKKPNRSRKVSSKTENLWL